MQPRGQLTDSKTEPSILEVRVVIRRERQKVTPNKWILFKKAYVLGSLAHINQYSKTSWMAIWASDGEDSLLHTSWCNKVAQVRCKKSINFKPGNIRPFVCTPVWHTQTGAHQFPQNQKTKKIPSTNETFIRRISRKEGEIPGCKIFPSTSFMHVLCCMSLDSQPWAQLAINSWVSFSWVITNPLMGTTRAYVFQGLGSNCSLACQNLLESKLCCPSENLGVRN
jgi:hypothetical protein